ncbi:MAG: IS66 family transposase, partial [Sodalis sp. (in: enterobacteria)]|uniref:IS66 family transposase n=6 Tax=Sodalis sp. (in: enterobacteria) TaxID=1898979 RepID=UPI0039E6A7EE
DPAVPPALRPSPVRRPLPPELPREERCLEPQEPACPACGGDLKPLGEDVSEQLELIKSAFKVIKIRRKKKACARCDVIVQVPAPSRPIERGIAGPGLLARLADAVCDYVMSMGKVHVDDTPVDVLQPGKGKPKTGPLWVYVRDDRNAGSTQPPAVWFAYSPDRKGAHPQTHLAGFSGLLQADAYAGFNPLYEEGHIREVGCMAHARRKIHDIHVRHPSPTTTEALRRIGELYAIEADIRGRPAEERQQVREARSRPILVGLESWVREKLTTLSRQADTAKAFNYLMNHWRALCYYAGDGWAEIDNNIAENALRVISLGRKNYLFFGSDSGGDRAALMYTLIGSCKLNGVEPEAYLRHVLAIIADHPINKIKELLPWNLTIPAE